MVCTWVYAWVHYGYVLWVHSGSVSGLCSGLASPLPRALSCLGLAVRSDVSGHVSDLTVLTCLTCLI